MADLTKTVTKIEIDMSYNNKLTEQIKGDTSDLVAISKGMRLLGRILAGLALIASGIGALEFIKQFLAKGA